MLSEQQKKTIARTIEEAPTWEDVPLTIRQQFQKWAEERNDSPSIAAEKIGRLIQKLPFRHAELWLAGEAYRVDTHLAQCTNCMWGKEVRVQENLQFLAHGVTPSIIRRHYQHLRAGLEVCIQILHDTGVDEEKYPALAAKTKKQAAYAQAQLAQLGQIWATLYLQGQQASKQR